MGVDNKKKKCDTSICPLPLCDLPEVLTAMQIKLAVEFLQLVYKQIASDLNISPSGLYTILAGKQKANGSILRVSSYIRKRLIVKCKNST